MLGQVLGHALRLLVVSVLERDTDLEHEIRPLHKLVHRRIIFREEVLPLFFR